MAYYITPNNRNTNGSYSGNCYAFGASGGFIVQQGFSEVILHEPDVLDKYDVTDAIQVQFSARTLNKKIGILKDSSNIRVVEAWYNPTTEKLGHDSLKLCACEYSNGLNFDSVISVGRLKHLYTDFKSTVNSYFGDPGGFASIFANANEFDINSGGVFDASAYIQVINSSSFTMSGSFVSDLSGDVHIYNINDTLKWVVDTNIFRNRSPSDRNYGMVDGFIAGDLVFIPEGFTITLSLDIEAETLLPINNVGPAFLNTIRDKLNWTRGYVKRTTTWSTTNITQTTTVPILLILTDTTLENYSNFGKSWSVASNVEQDGATTSKQDNWLAVSISSTGKHQTAITASGDIYVSNNFGTVRVPIYNIGESSTNSVAISFTGMHQTVSNGQEIYVSNDYGQTWTSTFNAGTSRIFVSISLNGQYQTLVSSGDNVYTSSDFGQTWTPADTESEIYYSVQAFPSASIAVSYNGLYQTIATENIYISQDYGRTWTNTTLDDFEDRNWYSLAMSSDGLYQTALESGGDIYISQNYGRNWTYVADPVVINKNWVSVSVSATGQYQTVLEQNGSIYTSIDFGYSWSIIDDPTLQNKKWQYVSVSSDALYQCAVEYGGHIYTSQVLVQQTDPDAEPCVCDDDD
jgi:photosystem II stability/assembly factor-like uncharacterized protein